ncbi:MAG TPA: methylated-DNA--[protein]-cysteine S-methyltransferase, partial [Dehalococcoidia bacterium]|nr:methylated-DNA--[protein]-cysteine S-methyltransferase [Dehalococcoidia bacterium]
MVTATTPPARRTAAAAAPTTAYVGITDTALGPMLIAGYGRSLVAIKFHTGERNAPDAIADIERETGGTYRFVRDDRRIAGLAKQVADYVCGRRTTFDVDLDLSWISGFRRDVMLACAAIPRGATASYADLARRVGRPGAARAVGNVMRTNPLPLVVPCHRVVGSNGSLTGFGGGLDVKRRLLEL